MRKAIYISPKTTHKNYYCVNTLMDGTNGGGILGDNENESDFAPTRRLYM